MTWRPLFLRGAALAVAASLFLGAAPVSADAPAAGTATLYIVHTNDLHGNLMPDSKGRGGMARIAGFLAAQRAEHPGQVIYLDAGDIAQGTPVSNLFHGEPMTMVLNRMEPAAGTVGNHEFDWGPKVMVNMTAKATYPLLVANLVDESGKPAFQGYEIVEVSGLKVGILGLTTEETPLYTKPGDTAGYKFLDPVETARKLVPRMKAEGAEVIVALTHLGLDGDKALAAAVPEIDAVVGGHSHSKLVQGEKVGDTPIVQSDKYGRHVGVLKLTVDPKADKVIASEARLVEVNDQAGLEPDPEVVALIATYDEKVKPIMAQVVGKSAAEMPKKHGDDQYDSPLGNVIADALRTGTGADVAVYNWGGIRDDSMPEGTITKETVFRILPFDDQVVRLTLKGSDLLDLVAQGALNEHGPMQVSGAGIAVDPTAKTVVEVTVKGVAVDPNGTYTVATTEFLAGGGDGYEALKRGTVTDRYDFARDVFMEYLDRQEVLPMPDTGRIKVVTRTGAR